MLSRFSKLPGVLTNVFQNTPNVYPQEDIDAAVTEIKRLGRASPTNEDTLQGLTRILALMKKYSNSLQVQRVACHALSNLAMQVVTARWIVQKGGFQLIKKCLVKFEQDHKLCWLASSAVWNLARPPANRVHIGEEGVQLMLRILSIHREQPKVTNTTIGALSNLSLCDSLKNAVATNENIELLLSVLADYTRKQSTTVMTSGAGLVANLAVSDEHANTLVNKNSVPIMLHLLHWDNQSEETLHRNACAALNNMVTADQFVDSFLECKGVEQVYEFLCHNTKDLYTNLLENCLINLDVDIDTKTTSIHLCALHGRSQILKTLIAQSPMTNLDDVDSKNMTAMDYAMSNKHMDIIRFLSKCGATAYQQNILHDSTQEQLESIKNALQDGSGTLKQVVYLHESTLCNTLRNVPQDLCKMMVTFNSNVDMLQAIEQYE